MASKMKYMIEITYIIYKEFDINIPDLTINFIKIKMNDNHMIKVIYICPADMLSSNVSIHIIKNQNKIDDIIKIEKYDSFGCFPITENLIKYIVSDLLIEDKSFVKISEIK